jgi:hypothetical protein
MGSSWSSVFSTTTPLETKTILDTILKRLITQVDMADMYSLADPRMCREYIVVATSALQKLFASIRLSKDKDGTLLFQKIRGIQERNPDAPEQQMRCRELSFFFVRIFQIYAAIALSIMDTEIPAADPLVIADKRQYKQRGVVFIDPKEGFRGFTKPQQQGWFSGFFGQQNPYTAVAAGQQGGALVDPTTLTTAQARRPAIRAGLYLDPAMAGDFAILNTYLVAGALKEHRQEEEANVSPLRLQQTHTDTSAITKIQASLGITQQSLFDFNYENPAQPFRKTKDLKDNGGEVKYIEAVYQYIQIGTNVSMKGSLNFSKRGGDTFVITLTNVKITTAGIRPTGANPNISRELGYTALGARIPVVVETNKEIPEVISEMFREAYKTLVPGISAVEFLRTKGLIQSIEGQVPILGTNMVTITNPKLYRESEIPITFTTRYKYEDRTITINIDTELIIIQARKSEMTEFQYTVKVNFNKLRTRPDYILNELNIPNYLGQQYQRGEVDEDARFRGKRDTFSTGIDDRSPPTNSRGETIPMFLERTFKGLLEATDEDVEGSRAAIRYTREGFPEPLDSDKIPPEMRIREIWRALAKDPPVKAHCVARAMQLLNVAAIKGLTTNEGFSSMCNLKFAYATDGSLPPAGRPVTESYGIQALSMLFVDNLQGGFPKITQSEQYKTFRKRFKLFFERYDSGKRLENITEPASLSDVKEYAMPGICEGHTTDRIQLERDMISQLRSITSSLISQQENHLRSAMGILFELFDESAVRAGRIEISRYVEQNGMVAVNQIAERARNLLADYYGNCENKYKEGLMLLYNKYNTDKESIRYTPAVLAKATSSDEAGAAAAARQPVAAPAGGGGP